MLNREKCFALLAKINSIMRESNVDYFVSNGTLLGIWRNGDFFAHDNDIDIGVLANTWKDNVFDKLVKEGFSPLYQFGEENNGLEYAFTYNQDTKLDIFFYYETKDYFWHAAWDQYPACGKKRQMLFHTYDKFTTKDLAFKNITIRIPESPARCLEQAYGQDWKTENKNWQWNRDPFNMTRKDIYIEYKDLRNYANKG